MPYKLTPKEAGRLAEERARSALFRQLINESRKILDNPRVNEKDVRGEYTSYAKRLRAKARSLLNRADQLLDEKPKRKIK